MVLFRRQGAFPSRVRPVYWYLSLSCRIYAGCPRPWVCRWDVLQGVFWAPFVEVVQLSGEYWAVSAPAGMVVRLA